MIMILRREGEWEAVGAQLNKNKTSGHAKDYEDLYSIIYSHEKVTE